MAPLLHERVCMLTLSHAAHFPNLAHRLERTYALESSGRPPSTVVVFDDIAAIAQFCTLHARNCTEAWEPAVTKLSLEEELRSLEAFRGQDAYAVVRNLVSGKLAIRNGDSYCHGEPLPPGCVGCRIASPGRSYQFIKKLYGAASPRAPSHCHIYWVSDAESFPFRPYDFRALMQWTVTTPPAPFGIYASWYPSRHSCEWICTAKENGAIAQCPNARCAPLISQLFGVEREIEEARNESNYSAYYAMARHATLGIAAKYRKNFNYAAFCAGRNGTRGESPATLVSRHPTRCRLTRSQQTSFDVGGNWWLYPVGTVREMMAGVERRHGIPMWRLLANSRLHDAAWEIWMVGTALRRAAVEEAAEAQAGGRRRLEAESDRQHHHHQRLDARNLIERIEARFPAPYAACCRCRQSPEGGLERPCLYLADLWSGCMRRAYATHGISLGEVGRFVVEDLGVFGLWWSTVHTLNATPPNVGRLDEILSSDPRLSWFINGVPVGWRA